MSENPEDYCMDGLFGKHVAGQNLEFLDEVKMVSDGKIYPWEEGRDEDYMWLGRMMETTKKDEAGNVMMHGAIVSKDKEAEYLQSVRQGVALSIFQAMGALFGFEVRPLKGDDENG